MISQHNNHMVLKGSLNGPKAFWNLIQIYAVAAVIFLLLFKQYFIARYEIRAFNCSAVETYCTHGNERKFFDRGKKCSISDFFLRKKRKM